MTSRPDAGDPLARHPAAHGRGGGRDDVDRDPWESRGACHGLDDHNLFFPDGPNDRATAAEAKAVCATCRVRQVCLEDALAGPDWPGVRGGHTEKELRAMRRHRRLEQLVADAITELVARERAVLGASPRRNPARWDRETRALIAARHGERLRERAAAQPDLSAVALADVVEAAAQGAPKTSKPRQKKGLDTNVMA
jgi:WhiB family redox-sensing transcriptional regulator